MTHSRGPLMRAMLACALFSIVEYAYWTAVLLYAYRDGGPTLAGFVLLAQLLPAAILASPLGAIGDRFPRGAALSCAYALEGLLLIVLASLMRAEAPLAMIVVASACATVVVSVCRPLHYAVLPQLAPTPTLLVRANAASSFVDGVGVFVGPAIAGVLAQQVDFWAVPMVCAIAMLVAGALVLRLGLPSAPAATHEVEEPADALAGVRAVARDRPVLALLLLVGVGYVVTGSLELLGVGYATDVLKAGESTQGVMVGAVGIGVFIGSVLAAGVAIHARLSPVIVLWLMVAGIPLLLVAAVASLVPAIALLTVCGLGIAISQVAGRTLLQRTTDAGLLARVFAVQESILLLGLCLGAILGPVLLGWLGASLAFVPIGIGLVLVAVLAWPVVRALDLRAVFRPDVLEAMRRVSFLVAMPPPALERLSQTAEWREVDSGDVVIRQGEVGDAFYVVDSGRLSVTVDGVLRDHTLTTGDGFGEIALLRDVPRTATITALEPTRLLRVERDDFLAAVTGSADGHAIAAQVAAAHMERDASAG